MHTSHLNIFHEYECELSTGGIGQIKNLNDSHFTAVLANFAIDNSEKRKMLHDF